jgi:hypothetical protein
MEGPNGSEKNRPTGKGFFADIENQVTELPRGGHSPRPGDGAESHGRRDGDMKIKLSVEERDRALVLTVVGLIVLAVML